MMNISRYNVYGKKLKFHKICVTMDLIEVFSFGILNSKTPILSCHFEMVWKPLFWIFYDMYENGLIITNYGHGEYIFVYDYDKDHSYSKVPHLV
jgi:hypothetical protein